MIHTIEITPDLSHEALLKLFRKKLMTGGAVLRIAPGLTLLEREHIFATFSPKARPHNTAELVLRALAESPELEPTLAEKLHALNLPGVKRGFSLREAARSLPGKELEPAC